MMVVFVDLRLLSTGFVWVFRTEFVKQLLFVTRATWYLQNIVIVLTILLTELLLCRRHTLNLPK